MNLTSFKHLDGSVYFLFCFANKNEVKPFMETMRSIEDIIEDY